MLRKNELPLLIFHGDNDELVPTEMAQLIFDTAKSKKDLWIVPGAGHTEAYTISEEEYKERLKAFLTDALQQ